MSSLSELIKTLTFETLLSGIKHVFDQENLIDEFKRLKSMTIRNGYSLNKINISVRRFNRNINL